MHAGLSCSISSTTYYVLYSKLYKSNEFTFYITIMANLDWLSHI